MRRQVKMILLTILIAVTILITGTGVYIYSAPQMGAGADPDRIRMYETSAAFCDTRFRNANLSTAAMKRGNGWRTMVEFFFRKNRRVPEFPLMSLPLDTDVYQSNDLASPLITWLGHSTLLIKMKGATILTDPVLSQRASMFSFMGPERFEYKHQYQVTDLPDIDVVLISHDHYDHLDYRTIRQLADRVSMFVVPLGVGNHLLKWGVQADCITELDWWQSYSHSPELQLTATPANHFSGRGLRDRNMTLWASWVIAADDNKLYFSGDSGYFEGFKEIGDRLGPFDYTFLECGAYNESWPDVHMMPEETVQAHIDLHGKYLMPIHWAKFNLSLHDWDEPIQRLLQAGQSMEITIAHPAPGDSFQLNGPIPKERWWLFP